VVQDNIFGVDVVRWLGQVRGRPRRLVVLRPSREVVAARDAERHARTGKIAYQRDGFTIDGLDTALAGTPRVGLWLDTSGQTADETVRETMLRADEALIS
jgi:hypothetical protein